MSTNSLFQSLTLDSECNEEYMGFTIPNILFVYNIIYSASRIYLKCTFNNFINRKNSISTINIDHFFFNLNSFIGFPKRKKN